MPNSDPWSPADPKALTVFQEELARAGAMPELTAADPALRSRFAGYYQGLARLPRKLRRALQRRWRRSLAGIALLCALGQAPALAATIVVDGTSCTLVDAITAANSDAAVANYAAGSGADMVVLPIFSTHRFGSPAVDVVFGAPCVTPTDQRGAPRGQDGDGDTFNDCDVGAVERGLVQAQATLNSTRVECRTAACQVPVTCSLMETGCTNEVELTVRRPRRNKDGTLSKAPRIIKFAAGVANIPPRGSGTVRLDITRQGRRLARETPRRRLKGVLAIREIPLTASVGNTPITISRTDVIVRLRRRR